MKIGPVITIDTPSPVVITIDDSKMLFKFLFFYKFVYVCFVCCCIWLIFKAMYKALAGKKESC